VHGRAQVRVALEQAPDDRPIAPHEIDGPHRVVQIYHVGRRREGIGVADERWTEDLPHDGGFLDPPAPAPEPEQIWGERGGGRVLEDFRASPRERAWISGVGAQGTQDRLRHCGADQLLG
jgi:hypothetical protein